MSKLEIKYLAGCKKTHRNCLECLKIEVLLSAPKERVLMKQITVICFH